MSILISYMFEAGAITTCAPTGTYIGILKKNVAGTSGDYTDATKEWQVVFDYTTITGNAACNQISGTYAVPKTNLYTNAGDEGIHCWCQMWPSSYYNKTTGLTSYWMYLTSYPDSTTCASTCTSACKTAVMSDTTFRGAMFESVW